MNKAVSIRDASADDAELLARIIRQSFRDVAVRFSLTRENCPRHPSNCTTEWIHSDLLRGVRYFILSHQDVPVGCVGMEIPGPGLCYLERLAVLPDYRHRGHGRMLVMHVLSQAKASGVECVSIGIIADHTQLKQWYRDLGFVETRTKSFSHLPFQVCFMELHINDTNDQSPKRM